MADITLYDYWRSSASYRVRIALNLKGLAYDQVVVNLLAGEHRADAHRARSPIGYVPALEIDGQMMTQSMAILEYLEARYPDPALLPADPAEAARLRAIAYAIAMDIHPICNLNVTNHHAAALDGDDSAKDAWNGAFHDPRPCRCRGDGRSPRHRPVPSRRGPGDGRLRTGPAALQCAAPEYGSCRHATPRRHRGSLSCASRLCSGGAGSGRPIAPGQMFRDGRAIDSHRPVRHNLTIPTSRRR